VKKWTKAVLAAASAVLFALSLAACNGGRESAVTATPGTSPDEASTATLIADFSNGSAEPNQREIPWKYDGACGIGMLSTSLSAATGLDFFVDGKIKGDKAFIAWWDTSTLVAGLGDREQNEDFFFHDAVSLSWFMMDSLAATVKRNIPEVKEVYYSGENGAAVVFTNPEDVAVQGLPELPVDQPYEGSAFFMSHADGGGDLSDGGSDGDLPYWNGFDFGLNLTYAEEYELQGDPGEYMNPAEAAKLTFDDVKHDGYIPEYSDKTEYKIVLVDLADIEGEECYIYRLDVDEPTGTIGAAYAFAYQSGIIYMQGQGGQWVPLAIGDGDYGEEGID
jgi:hypothetical protein